MHWGGQMTRVLLGLATVGICILSMAGIAQAGSQSYPPELKLEKSMQKHINDGAKVRHYKWRYGPIKCVAVDTTDVAHTWSCTGNSYYWGLSFGIGRKLSSAHWTVTTQIDGSWDAKSVWEFSDTVS
jgi:hypothetical protein